MKKIILYIVTLIVVTNTNIAQSQSTNIGKGFELIDARKYNEALEIFKSELEKTPNEKNVWIGYGRAMGLKGEAKEAHVFFEKCLLKKPNDLDLLLNNAESFLWCNDALNGEKAYRNLAKTFPKNFIVQIGLGNSLSMQKRYFEAMAQYETAKRLEQKLPYIDVLLTNVKINLGFQLYNEANYEQSKYFYRQVLKSDSLNVQAIEGIANNYLLQDSLKLTRLYYEKLKLIKGQEIKAIVMIGYVSKLQYKYAEALRQNKKAFNLCLPTDTAQYLWAASNLMYANLWSSRVNKAANFFHNLEENYPNRKELVIPKAQLQIFQGKMKQAAKTLSYYVRTDSTSFDANLGLTDINLGLEDFKRANYYLTQSLKYYPNQPDVIFVTKKYYKAIAPTGEAKWLYFQDNNKNYSNQFNYEAIMPISWKKSIGIQYNYLNIGINNEAPNTNMSTLSGTFTYKPKAGTTLSIQGSFNHLDGKIEHRNLLYRFVISQKIEGGHFAELSTSKEVFYYSANLLNKNILINNYTLIYSGKIKNTVGVYSNLQYSNFNDKNSRKNAYTAFYASAPTKNLKTGTAFQVLSFDLQVPAIYYSPKRMTVIEYFIEYNNFLLEEKKLQYSLEFSTGRLKEMNLNAQQTFRVKAFLQYSFGENSKFYVRGLYGNSSQLQLNLYSISLYEAGIKIAPEWLVSKKFRIDNSKH